MIYISFISEKYPCTVDISCHFQISKKENLELKKQRLRDYQDGQDEFYFKINQLSPESRDIRVKQIVEELMVYYGKNKK